MLCRRAILEARVAPEHFESGRYRPVLVQVPNKKPIVGTDPSCTFAHTVTVMIEIAITAVCARLDAISVEVNHNRRGAALGFIQIWALLVARSEESRVGTECVSTCRSRWSPYH